MKKHFAIAAAMLMLVLSAGLASASTSQGIEDLDSNTTDVAEFYARHDKRVE